MNLLQAVWLLEVRARSYRLCKKEVDSWSIFTADEYEEQKRASMGYEQLYRKKNSEVERLMAAKELLIEAALCLDIEIRTSVEST